MEISRFCAGRGAPRPGDFRPIDPRSGGQRRGFSAGPENARSTRKGRAPSMASTIEEPTL
jgi:hypothetical protein